MANHTHPSTLQLRNATCKIVGTLLNTRRCTSLRQAFFHVLESIARSNEKTNTTTFTGFELYRSEQNTPQKLYYRFVKFAKSPLCQEPDLMNFVHFGQIQSQRLKMAA